MLIPARENDPVRKQDLGMHEFFQSISQPESEVPRAHILSYDCWVILAPTSCSSGSYLLSIYLRLWSHASKEYGHAARFPIDLFAHSFQLFNVADILELSSTRRRVRTSLARSALPCVACSLTRGRQVPFVPSDFLSELHCFDSQF